MQLHSPVSFSFKILECENLKKKKKKKKMRFKCIVNFSCNFDSSTPPLVYLLDVCEYLRTRMRACVLARVRV